MCDDVSANKSLFGNERETPSIRSHLRSHVQPLAVTRWAAPGKENQFRTRGRFGRRPGGGAGRAVPGAPGGRRGARGGGSAGAGAGGSGVSVARFRFGLRASGPGRPPLCPLTARTIRIIIHIFIRMAEVNMIDPGHVVDWGMRKRSKVTCGCGEPSVPHALRLSASIHGQEASRVPAVTLLPGANRPNVAAGRL